MSPKYSHIPLLICFFSFYHSDRLDVYECLNHKWLDDSETPPQDQQQQQQSTPPPQILTVQTSNVTITTTNATEESVSATKGTTTATIVTQSSADDEVKTDEIILTNGKYFVDKDADHNARGEEDKENSRVIREQEKTMAIIPFQSTKLVLEKSSSISLFPDAPTTPKVCRKMIYEDEAELKEIVKKYQTVTTATTTAACCDDQSSVGECLVCHPNLSASKTSLELDKGITSC
jgi:serine/threonine protein kinase